jgi:adenylate cyclase
MARVTLADTGASVEVETDTLLIRACKQLGIAVPNLCANKGLCATCAALVVDGADQLSAPGRHERATLKWIGAPVNVRLTCQAKVRGNVTVRAGISPLADIGYDPTTHIWGEVGVR